MDLLSMAEFQYNNHIHSSTQQTPFLLDSGQHPWMGFKLKQPAQVEAVNKFMDQMKMVLEEAKSALNKAKDDMARYYNQWRLSSLLVLGVPTPTYKSPGTRTALNCQTPCVAALPSLQCGKIDSHTT